MTPFKICDIRRRLYLLSAGGEYLLTKKQNRIHPATYQGESLQLNEDNKYQKPILPIAIFSYDSKHTENNEFTIDFPFFHFLTFNFLMVELKKINWRDYIKSNNPVVAALLSKMGYTKEEKVQVKIEFLRMIVKMELNPALARFINDFFEQYLTLDEKEEEMLLQEISQSENPEQFTELPNSWEERGIRKGIEQGTEEATKNIALEMLKEGLSTDFIARVNHLDIETVEQLKNND